MPEFQTKRRVQHGAAEMFDLVADVERYPQFVPLCSGIRIRSRNVEADGSGEVEVTVIERDGKKWAVIPTNTKESMLLGA